MPDVGYCEPADVKSALQEHDMDATYGAEWDTLVGDAIRAQSEWLRKQTRRHWFDSGAAAGDLVSSSPMTATEISLDVPSSPHVQDRQVLNDEVGARYPRTTAGPYAKLRLPHYHVDSLSALRVRQWEGDVVDWTTDPEQDEGRGEDYYLTTSEPEGASHLHVHEASIGPRVDYGGLLTLDYEFGADGVPDSVRRAVAMLAGADFALNDEGEVAIPSDGQLISLETKADKMRKTAHRLLKPYKETPIA